MLARPLTLPRASAQGAASAVLLAGLAAIVGARWLATRLGLDALLVGAAFGAALAWLWVAADGRRIGLRRINIPRAGRHGRPRRARLARGLVAGAVVGLALVAVAVASGLAGGPALPPGSLRPAAPFADWVLVTILVATAEEGILRGVVFDRLSRAGGTAVALAITTMAFAVIHVPLYGWAVVPLDLAVGLALGGLRLSTRTVVGPAVAHAVADLATWWL
ncbi:MAG TPA: type II CAAX endopeptidase family protein [Candidatus Binatia bacterium]|nr:type II CAAX endopeptidase family protein [Candidatus Binatia bacterium]